MAITANRYVTDWVEECRELLQPDRVLWIDGSPEQLESLRQEAYRTGELVALNQEKLPGCVYHRSALNDVARVESRTYICCKRQEDAGPTNNWVEPEEMKARLREIYAGAMKGRTMYVIPYSMGIVGSPFAKYGVEITDSIYVVVSMAIMTRVGTDVYDALGDSPDYIRGLHAKAELDEEKRYIVHFPEENTIMSVNSGYGGNVLLGKKCFALRIASCLGRDEGWLAEHMLILGVENPQGEVRYVCGAFPSACGKTNLAMLVPPQAWREKGLEVLVRGGRHRLAPAGSRRPVVGGKPGKGLLRRGARYQRKDQPQCSGHHPEGHHFHQRGAQAGRDGLVGGAGQKSAHRRA